MRFHVITLFPESIESYRNSSIIKRAEEKELIHIFVSNPRDYSNNKHNSVDDKPYGGGPGMVIMALPILQSIQASLQKVPDSTKPKKYILFSPHGKKFTNKDAKEWASHYNDIIMICGRYEGVDDRVRQALDAEEISIGDYVLTGGELPALVVMDTVSRQISGVLGNALSIEEERVASSRVYTRPDTFEWEGSEYDVPEVLRNGNHSFIEEWRKKTHYE